MSQMIERLVKHSAGLWGQQPSKTELSGPTGGKRLGKTQR